MNLRIIFRKKLIIYYYVIEAFTLLENKSIIPLTGELFQIDIPEVNISSLTVNTLKAGGLSGEERTRVQNLPVIDVNTSNQIYYSQYRLTGPADFLITWEIRLPTEGKYIYSYNYGARGTADSLYTEDYDIVPSLKANLLGSIIYDANSLIVQTNSTEYTGELNNSSNPSDTVISAPYVYVNVTYYRVS